ncbi:MAG: MerR family transcriptional regulator [Anaerolineae bacterium]|jgi:DNA-binding transcriptional MerR regulator
MRRQIPSDLFTIGEFAEISEVPAKTLRYYDRIGLFKPDYIDPSTNYRYYSPHQVPRISQILALKDLGLSLKQIGQLLEGGLPLAELRGMLRLKRIEIQERLRHQQAQLARVETRLSRIEEARLTARGEEKGMMRTCPSCGRRVPEDDLHLCPYCGRPLAPTHADFLPVKKPAKELAMRSVGLLLAALALVAAVAGLLTGVVDGQDERGLIFRPPVEPREEQVQLALVSIDYERVEDNRTFMFQGQIKNISDTTMEDTVVVISLYDADPAVITSSRAPIGRRVLSPGETSAFTVETDTIPQAHYYGVVFQQPSGGTIPMFDDRSA